MHQTASQESDFLEVLDPRLRPGAVDREAREPPAREANASIRTSTNEAITIEFYNPQGITSKTRKIISARKRAKKNINFNEDINHISAFEFIERDGSKGT